MYLANKFAAFAVLLYIWKHGDCATYVPSGSYQFHFCLFLLAKTSRKIFNCESRYVPGEEKNLHLVENRQQFHYITNLLKGIRHKDQQPCHCLSLFFVNFIQSVILEGVQSK